MDNRRRQLDLPPDTIVEVCRQKIILILLRNVIVMVNKITHTYRKLEPREGWYLSVTS